MDGEARGGSGGRAFAPGRRTLRWGLTALAALALCAQGLIYSVHSDRVLSRADTRTLTREWMVAHIPAGTRIVVEPVSPDAWAKDIGAFNPTTPDGARWIKYASLHSVFAANGAFVRDGGPTHPTTVGIEDYERTLRPGADRLLRARGLLLGDKWLHAVRAGLRRTPRGARCDRLLPRAGGAGEGGVSRLALLARGRGPVAFNFDWSFDYYPLAYHRPGPKMTVYRLRGGRCGA